MAVEIRFVASFVLQSERSLREVGRVWPYIEPYTPQLG
jgi:hypothetical protein